MKKFEICYEIDRNTVLIPDLLEVQEPEFDFNYETSLRFIIEYDFLPRSVMPRFIVKMHKDIKEQLRWRTGVVLEDEDYKSTAVIKSDDEAKRMYIYVNGEQKRDCFSVIRKTFRDINNSFEKLETTELIPLPDNDEIVIEYEELIGYELARRDEYFVGRLRKGYSVKQLLDGIEKEEERKRKSERGDKINIHIHDLVKDSGKADVKVEQSVQIEINLNVELPPLQEYFDELRDLLIETNPNLERKLNEIGDSLDELGLDSKKEEFNKPLNKLGRFLRKVNDESSEYHKLIKGTKKGIKLAQKLGKTYNKFAQWLALPQVPDLFLGE